jgi:hypothetical protein
VLSLEKSVDNLVSVGVDEICTEFNILALHQPCRASLESIHCATLCTILQEIYTKKAIKSS